VNSGIWDEWWTRHLEKGQRSTDALDEFWKIFIDELIEVVTEDGVVDFREPENIYAWVDPPYATLVLERENSRVIIGFWTRREDSSERHLFDRVLKIQGGQADLTAFGMPGHRSAALCGSVVGKLLFSLRTPEAE
jgi:hypothetical protein